MGLYIVGTPDALSKQEFVSSDALGADLLTEVLAAEAAIFVGPDPGTINLNEIVTGLGQCQTARREAGIFVPLLGRIRVASVVPGAGRAAVVVDDDALLLLETVVAVAYGEDFLILPDHIDSSIFFTNMIGNMIDWWMETVGKLK